MYVANLIFDLPIYHQYSYTTGIFLETGQRVTAKLRNKEQVAFVTTCIALEQFNDFPIDKLQPVIQIFPQNEAIPADIWKLCKFAADYYHHSFGSTLFCAIPALLRKSKPAPLLTRNSNAYYRLTTTGKSLSPRGTKQNLLWQQLLINNLNPEQIREIIKNSPKTIISKWLATGIIEEVMPPHPATTTNEIQTNPEQQYIINEIGKQLNQFHSALIYGITGSGKTEVFLQLIHKVLMLGQQVLVLVPEINLTPQFANRFQQRFPHARIAILNSEISDNQRLNSWQQAKDGEINLILGTRLGIFTPFNQLGLIIVDEEHDDSFKQNDNLRYHARDLAIYRARQLNIPVIMASATPSLETLYNYKLGKHHLYKLTQRAVSNSTLPEIRLVNLAHYPVNDAGVSNHSLEAIKRCIIQKEMALVFINRRGYAPVLTCYDCGWISQCQHCSSKMVYHNKNNCLKCHHCGFQMKTPACCPKCHNQYLHTLGHGTQKLEEFLQIHFPQAAIRRVDRDTTSRKNDWQQLYQEINENKIDILVGTQMLAKGHDFPNLTLVVGLNLDNALFSYDFRASEDMFNVLTQVAGRAGRGNKPGQVLLQTHYPEHPLYHYLQQHNFEGFINFILKERQQSQLPPYCYQALVKISSLKEHLLTKAILQLGTITKAIQIQNVAVFAPVPAVMYKLHKRYRGQMLISSSNRNQLHTYLQMLEPQLTQISYVTVAIDVDPREV